MELPLFICERLVELLEDKARGSADSEWFDYELSLDISKFRELIEEEKSKRQDTETSE